MRSVLFAFEELCAVHRVDLVPRWLFLDRLALALYDFGKWSLSAHVLQASVVLRSQLRADQRNQTRLDRDLMRSVRREGMIAAFSSMTNRASLQAFVERLKHDATAFLRMGDPDGFATNLDVAAKVNVELLGNDEQALALGEHALEARGRISHKWVIQEHHWRLAEIYRRKRSRPNEKKHVVAALREFQDTPVILEPILLGNGPVEHDPIRDLPNHGFSDAVLRDAQVTPPQNTPRATPFGSALYDGIRISARGERDC
jgi:hypothetical protein